MEVKRLSETPVNNYEPTEYTSTLKHNCEMSKYCKMCVIPVSFFTLTRRSYFHFIRLQIASVAEKSSSNKVKCSYNFVHLFLDFLNMCNSSDNGGSVLCSGLCTSTHTQMFITYKSETRAGPRGM
jgi:hypothetical protein